MREGGEEIFLSLALFHKNISFTLHDVKVVEGPGAS